MNSAVLERQVKLILKVEKSTNRCIKRFVQESARTEDLRNSAPVLHTISQDGHNAVSHPVGMPASILASREARLNQPVRVSLGSEKRRNCACSMEAMGCRG